MKNYSQVVGAACKKSLHGDGGGFNFLLRSRIERGVVRIVMTEFSAVYCHQIFRDNFDHCYQPISKEDLFMVYLLICNVRT